MKKLFVITGEHSGDLHASRVIENLKLSMPDLEIEGIGGENLKNAGVKLFRDHSKMSAFGFNFKILFDHLKLGKDVADYLINEYKPDLVLMIDYGGFNLNLSKVLKKAGLKIFYYIPPQIWASRKWRLNTVEKCIDKVLTIFPFEAKMYEERGIDVEFVGNPTLTSLIPKADKNSFFERNNLDINKPLVSIFPGSRKMEIKFLLPVFLKSAEIIKKKNPDVQFVICQANNISDELLHKYLKNTDIQVLKNSNYALLSVSDALILASGTVALEACLYETPFLIAYKVFPLVEFIYKALITVRFAALPNLIMDRAIIKEFIQRDCKEEDIAEEIISLLTNEEKRNKMKKELSEVRTLLGDKNSFKNVADIIKNTLK